MSELKLELASKKRIKSLFEKILLDLNSMKNKLNEFFSSCVSTDKEGKTHFHINPNDVRVFLILMRILKRVVKLYSSVIIEDRRLNIIFNIEKLIDLFTNLRDTEVSFVRQDNNSFVINQNSFEQRIKGCIKTIEMLNDMTLEDIRKLEILT